MQTLTVTSGHGKYWRLLSLVAAAMTLAACNTTAATMPAPLLAAAPGPMLAAPLSVVERTMVEEVKETSAPLSGYQKIYGAVNDRGTVIPALDLSKIDKRNLRKEVDYKTSQPAGTVIVDPYKRYLYLVMPNDRAMRYAVGVGRAGLTFNGSADIARKAQWPRWTPTANMIKRNPDHFSKYANGLEGGIRNPLGARALYLHRDNQDTLYRIHGTNEPWSIGKAASSGCIRLFNQDIMDLYERVPRGAKVVVLDATQSKNGEI